MTTELKPQAITFHTDGSAIPNPGMAGYGAYGTDDQGMEYNIHGPVGTNASNNEAELTAVIRVIQYTMTTDILKLTIHSDSRYVVDGIGRLKQWEKNKWTTSTGNPLANLVLWKELQTTLAEYKALSGQIDIYWIRGHSGIIENEIADRNANMGRITASLGETVHTCTKQLIADKVISDVITITSKTAIAVKPNIYGKRWFFNTNQTTVIPDGRFFYTSTTYKDEKKKKNQNVGKRSPDTHYSILLTDTPIPELDSLRNKFDAAFPNMMVPVLVNLPTVTMKTVWPELVENKNKFTTIKGNLAVTINNDVLGEVITPPKLIFKLVDIFRFGFKLIDDWEAHSDRLLCIDISKAIITSTGKLPILNAAVTNSLTCLTIAKDDYSELPFDIKLNIGFDIPLRSNFSTMLKLKTKPKVVIHLLLWEITEHSYRVATVVECGTDKSIYFTPDANYRLINK